MTGRDRLRDVQNVQSISTTAKRSRSLLPSDPPEQGASQAELAAWATVALGLGGDPIESATRYGRHLDARMSVTLKSGQWITFERQADVFEPRKLMQTVIAHTGAGMPHYGPADGQKIATALVRLSDLIAEDDQRAEAIDWADSFLARAARNIHEIESFNTPEGRWEALSIINRFQPPADVSPYAPAAERSVIVQDATGRRLVRVGDVAAHVRGELGKPISWPALHSRMVEIGWENRGQVQQRQPRSGREGHKLKARVYAIPADWEDQ